MSIIDAGTLAEFKLMAEGVMLDTVTIRRKGARTATPLGGSFYAPPAETVTTGRVAPLSKTTVERLSGAQLRQEGLEELHVPKDTDVTGADTVVVESERHGTTRSYRVEGVQPLGTFDVDRIVLVRPV